MSIQTQARSEDEIIRSMIQNENEVINHRVTWLTGIQALLFAALGFLWEKPGDRSFMYVLGVLGIGASVAVFFALAGASRAQWLLYDWWQRNRPPWYSGPSVMGQPPSKVLVKIGFAQYIGAWGLLPLFFIVAWVVALSLIPNKAMKGDEKKFETLTNHAMSIESTASNLIKSMDGLSQTVDKNLGEISKISEQTRILNERLDQFFNQHLCIPITDDPAEHDRRPR